MDKRQERKLRTYPKPVCERFFNAVGIHKNLSPSGLRIFLSFYAFKNLPQRAKFEFLEVFLNLHWIKKQFKLDWDFVVFHMAELISKLPNLN